MPFNRIPVFLCGSLEDVSRKPCFITRRLCALGKDLEFPLASRYFTIDTFNVESGIKTEI